MSTVAIRLQRNYNASERREGRKSRADGMHPVQFAIISIVSLAFGLVTPPARRSGQTRPRSLAFVQAASEPE